MICKIPHSRQAYNAMDKFYQRDFWLWYFVLTLFFLLCRHWSYH